MSEPREVFFEAAEYARRLDKVRASMAAGGVDLLVTTHPAHVCYSGGSLHAGGDRPHVPHESHPTARL